MQLNYIFKLIPYEAFYMSFLLTFCRVFEYNYAISGDIMFNSKASIKFMMAKIFFNLANFSYNSANRF